MADAKTYSGSCHCGAVRYQVELTLGTGMACNCSICSRRGWLLAFVPRDQLRVLAGEDHLTDYQFGRHRIHHLFCKTCGVASFSHATTTDGRNMAAINLRTLEDVDLSTVTVKQVDGKSLPAT